MAARLAAAVAGAHLPRYFHQVPVGQDGVFQQRFIDHHRQNIGGARQPGYLQRKTEKPPSVIFMGKDRRTGQNTPQNNMIGYLFHSPTSLSFEQRRTSWEKGRSGPPSELWGVACVWENIFLPGGAYAWGPSSSSVAFASRAARSSASMRSISAAWARRAAMP